MPRWRSRRPGSSACGTSRTTSPGRCTSGGRSAARRRPTSADGSRTRTDNDVKDGHMGGYVSVRGWMECDETQLATVQEIISSHADDHYSNGWSTPRQQVNWTCYLFYGADIR